MQHLVARGITIDRRGQGRYWWTLAALRFRSGQNAADIMIRELGRAYDGNWRHLGWY